MQFYKISVGRYSSRVNSFNTFSDNLSRYKAARIFNPSRTLYIKLISWNDFTGTIFQEKRIISIVSREERLKTISSSRDKETTVDGRDLDLASILAAP